MDKIYILSNSIKVHFLPIKTNGLIYLYIGFGKGASIDEYGKEGTVHLFEHLLTSLLETSGLQTLLEDNGFDINGETDLTKMALTVETDKQHIKETISLIVNTLNNIRIYKKQLAVAKKVVKAEFYERFKEADNISFLTSLKNGTYKYKRFSRDESIKSISAVKIKDIKKVQKLLFSKSNIFITIIGCNDEDSSFILSKFSKIKVKENIKEKKSFSLAVKPMKDFYIPKKNIGNFTFSSTPSISNYIVLEILTHHLIGWYNAILDYYLRSYASISYGAGNYISFTEKNIISTYYFEAYNKKMIYKGINHFKKEDFMPTLKQFNIAKKRFIIEFYEKANDDICSYFEDIHLNISKSIKYNELLSQIKSFKYEKFKRVFKDLEFTKYAS